MRKLFIIFALAGLAGSAQAQTLKPSQAACDSKKIGARELSECLRNNVDKSEKFMADAVEAAIKSIDGRAGLVSAQKARWRRALNDSQAQWVGWRDTDCQDVAPFEAGLGFKGADPRLSCIIDHNVQRTDEMKARYP